MLSALDFLKEGIHSSDAASTKKFDTIVDDTPMDDHSPDIPTKEGADETPVVDHPTPNHVNISVNLDRKGTDTEKLKDIVNNRATERLQELHACMEAFELEYDPESVAGEEGFGSFVLNCLTGIANTITGILFLFKTGLFDGWRDFKRSELTEYCQAHVFTVKRLKHLTEGEFAPTEFEKPRGMLGSYMNAINSLEAVFNEMNIEAAAKRMLTVAKDIRDKIRTPDNVLSGIIEASNRDFDKIEKNVTKVFDKSSAIFTEKKTDTATFKELYGNTMQFEAVIDKLQDMDDVMRSVAGIESTMEDIEKVVKETIDDVKRYSVNIPKKTLDQFVAMIRNWGFMFEKFSVAVNDLYRVNHNVCINLKIVANKL